MLLLQVLVSTVVASRGLGPRALLVLAASVCTVWSSSAAGADAGGYYGKLVGALTELHHGVSGTVYAVDARTLHIRDFTYDGEGPDAFFYAGTSKAPSGSGFRIRDEKGTLNVLKRYRKKHVTLTLPEGKTLANIRWFSVWCREFSVNFGDVKIPKGFDFPKPHKLGALSGIHGVSSEAVVVVDAQTMLVPNFSYDGEAPDAKFWVGPGTKPTPQGIRVADENGRFEPLKRYDRKTLVITLPGSLTVHEIGHFGVWCEAFAVDFAHVEIPNAVAVPPSLRMLGVSPQSKLNCEVLNEALALEVRWAVAGDSVVTQLVGKIDAGDYMAFGVSGELERTQMIGGDAVVAWVDHETLQGNAHDYYLDAKSQCAGSRGSCPDKNIQDGTESVRLLNAALVNGYSIITYQRPLRARDDYDRTIYSNGTLQAIIWAVGPLNSRNEVSYHSIATRGNILFDFGRSPEWNCPLPESATPSPDSVGALGEVVEEEIPVSHAPVTHAPATPAPAPTGDAWFIPPIQCHEPEDGVFYAQMGPTGGKRGYPAITGHVGWGISWYINGLLIPQINVVRGKSYTFVVEGGDMADVPARYHPFYITDDPVGGYEYKTPEERKNVHVYAGVKFDKRGKATPTGTGRLCNWTPDPEYPADESESFGAYQRSLRLECDPGEPGILRWTPDANTPDTVYYQCFTHRYLGWKINVVDSCDQSSSASENQDVEYDEESGDGLDSGASIQVITRVKVPDADLEKFKDIAYFQDEKIVEDLSPPSVESTAQRVSYITSLTSKTNGGSVVNKAPLFEEPNPVHVKKDKPFLPTPGVDLTPPPITHEPISSGFNTGVLVVEQGFQPLPSDQQKEETVSEESTTIIIEGGRRNGDVEESATDQESLFESPKNTETFEPMFIPSPVDRNRIPESDNISNPFSRRPVSINQRPSINSLDSKPGPFFRRPSTNTLHSTANRPRPAVLMRRPSFHVATQQSHGMSPPPVQSNNFRRYQPKRPLNFGDVAAANERVDTYYLPPNSNIEQVYVRNVQRPIPSVLQVSSKSVDGSVLTYDGQKIKDSTIINPPPTEQLTNLPSGRSASSQGSQLLLATPQFGPFRGEIPPPVPVSIPSNSPQLRHHQVTSDVSKSDELVSTVQDQSEIVAAASSNIKSVVKRWASPDHKPGHEGPDHDDHDHHSAEPEPSPEPEPSGDDHDHQHHDHNGENSSARRTVTFAATSIMCLAAALLLL